MKHTTKTPYKPLLLALTLTVTTSLVACDTGDDAEDNADAVDIAGTYADEYDQTHVVGDTEWTISAMDYSSSFAYVTVNNEERYIIAQNSVENDFSGGLFSRLDWFFDAEGSLRFCTCAYDAQTPEIALACESDAQDLSAGCGGFSWSLLTPQ
jgi:hypothetical protein